MDSSYETLYALCKAAYSELPIGESLATTVLINNVSLNLNLYRLPDDFIFDSAETVSSVFSLLLGVDGATQILLGKNITVASGVTLIPKYRCKGMIIFAKNSLVNNGIISMTARGASAAGQNIYLIKNKDSSYEYIPATGGAGGAGFTMSSGSWAARHGTPGNVGTNRGTGGGGSGSSRIYVCTMYVSAGGSGTSYSGGAGSGGATSDRGSSNTSGGGSSTGGAGGAGVDSGGNPWARVATGGAGNNAGATVAWNVASYLSHNGNGTGGLLVVFSRDMINSGAIEAKGISAPYGSSSSSSRSYCTGGGSGGGSINIFYSNIINDGSIVATGGLTVFSTTSGDNYGGGGGGNGSVTLYAKRENFIFVEDENLLKYFSENLWHEIP